MMTTVDREAVRRDVEARVKLLMPKDLVGSSGGCFFYAVATVEAIRAAGPRAILQAGSCLWPRIRKDQDDGKCNTHFGYQWSPKDLASLLAIAQGALPEMHLWAAIPDQHEVVDFTTSQWPAQAMKLCGYDWPGDRPPEYLWAQVNRLHSGVTYDADFNAIRLAVRMAIDLLGAGRAKELIS